jgi:hypothetical protein
MATPAQHLELVLASKGAKIEVKEITDGGAIDSDDEVGCQEAGPVRGRLGTDRGHGDALAG